MFFKSADKEKCPVKTCTMKQKDCETNFVNDNVSMATTAPWALTILDDTFAGYGPYEACVVCDNEFQTIRYDQISITQEGRCIDKLEKKTLEGDGWPKPLWEYDQNAQKTPEVFVDSWTRLFNNKDPDPT